MKINSMYTLPQNICELYIADFVGSEATGEEIDMLFAKAKELHPELRRENIMVNEELSRIMFPVAYIPCGVAREEVPKKHNFLEGSLFDRHSMGRTNELLALANKMRADGMSIDEINIILKGHLNETETKVSYKVLKNGKSKLTLVTKPSPSN